MRFRQYLQEAVIVPDRIKITTTDIDELEAQFADTIVTFEEVDDINHTGGGYIPELDEIEVRVHPDMNLNSLEAIINHEIIHSIQDQKSNMRMAASIEKERLQQKKITTKIQKLDMSKPAHVPKIMKLAKELEKTEVKRAFDNAEEKMTYAYMAVKMRGSENIKEVIKDFNNWWTKMTNGKKMDKRMLKYFYSYWMIKDKL